jgi:hypothetical protein
MNMMVGETGFFGRNVLPGGHVADVTSSAIRNPRFGLLGASATQVTTPPGKWGARMLARWTVGAMK